MSPVRVNLQTKRIYEIFVLSYLESMQYSAQVTLAFGRCCKIHPTSEAKMNISQVSFGCACEQTSEVCVKGSESK